MSITQEQMRAIIEKAKEDLARKNAAKGIVAPSPVKPTVISVPPPATPVAAPPKPSWTWNEEQNQAIENGVVGKSFVLIGAAGTGKTTTLRGLLAAKLASNSVPVLKTGTQCLAVGSAGVVLLSYTRRAVRNIAKQMPQELKDHCLTFHKVLEYAPEIYYEANEFGTEVKKMRFAPQRHSGNPLPEEITLVVVDESSMVSIELFEIFCAALPNIHRVQFIFLGDLNQLPPVYGQAVLGQKLLQLPIVELTQVYRQALESPIIALALAVKNNNFAQFNRDAVDLWSGDRFIGPDGKKRYMAFDAKNLTSLIDKTDKKKPAMIVLEKPGRGKVTLQVWKNKTETEVGLAYMQGQMKAFIDSGKYNPDEDLVLCAWNKSFGTDELNAAIADKLGKDRNAEIYEVIAGFQKYYYAVGDKLLVDKQEAVITSIVHNPKYLGKRAAKPSSKMDRWGNHADHSLDLNDFAGIDIDELLGDLSSNEDRVAAASHIIHVRYLDSDSTYFIDKAAELNKTSFGYAITVHKAQGSECRRVFFLTHYCHSGMMYRELVYTAITRAAEELHLVLTPYMLETASNKPRIKGDTLKAKLEFYAERLKERIDNDD